EVHGTSSDDVLAVTKALAEVATNRKVVEHLRSPWVSGTFYLVALSVAILLLLVVGEVTPLWVLPLIVVGTILLMATIGVLQLRQDDRLSERGFLRLMGDVMRRIPQVLSVGRLVRRPEEADP